MIPFVRTQTTYIIEPSPYSPKRSNLMSLAAWMPSSLRFFSICLLLARAARSSAEEVHPILQVPSVQNVAPVYSPPVTTKIHTPTPILPNYKIAHSQRIGLRINTDNYTFCLRQGLPFPASFFPMYAVFWTCSRKFDRPAVDRTIFPANAASTTIKRTHTLW